MILQLFELLSMLYQTVQLLSFVQFFRNYFRKLDFPRIEQCAAWLNSERYHWGGWHIRIPTSRPRFGIILATAHCWWNRTSFKCAHKLAILVVRTSFSIVYEKHYHNHAIFRVRSISAPRLGLDQFRRVFEFLKNIYLLNTVLFAVIIKTDSHPCISTRIISKK